MSDDNSKKRLGRGLAALMGDLDKPIDEAIKSAPDMNQTPKASSGVQGERVVPIEKIRANPNNPRRYFSDSDLQDLTASIREHGIVQPILVRPIKTEDLGGAEFEIIAGERRWRSAQKAALHEVPIVIREVGDKQALELAIIENVQRADLNSVEEALGYQQLINEYDYSQNDLAQVIGKSRSHVANTLRLLKLPESVQSLISDGEISAGHARTLVTADQPEMLAKRIISEGLSVRQAEALSQTGSVDDNNNKAGKSSTVEKSADVRSFENRIEESLGLKIDLRHKDNGKGEIRIQYKSLEQLDEIERRLGKSN